MSYYRNELAVLECIGGEKSSITISKPLLHPFAAVAMGPGNATVTYSNTTDSTVLAIATGGLTATIPTGPAVASAAPGHFAGARAITLDGDGRLAAHCIGRGAVVPGMQDDSMNMKLSASGVRWRTRSV